MNNEINVNTNENKISNINYSSVEQTKKKSFSFQEIKQIWKDSLGFKPIISYLYFLFVFLIKKKGTWIIPLISFLLILIFSLIPSFIGQLRINNLMLYFSVVMSLFFSISFVVVKIINIFKDGQDEGIEIIIVSKPIERWQIIAAKFTMFVALSLFITFVNVIALSIGFAFSWDYTLYPQGFGSTIGIVIGGTLLVCLFFGSLTVLFSLKFGKKLSANLPTTIFSVLFGVSMMTTLVPSLKIYPSDTADGMVNNIINTSSVYGGTNYPIDVNNLVNMQKISYNNKSHLAIRLKNTNNDSIKWSYVYPYLKELYDKGYGSGDWIKAFKWLNVVNIPLDNDTGFDGLFYYYDEYDGGNAYLKRDYFYGDTFDINYSYHLGTGTLPKDSVNRVILQNFYETESINRDLGMKIMVQNSTNNWKNINIPEYILNETNSNSYDPYYDDYRYYTKEIIDQLSNNSEFIKYVLDIMLNATINDTTGYKDGYTAVLEGLTDNFRNVGYNYVEIENSDPTAYEYRLSFEKYNEFINKYLYKKVDVSKLFDSERIYDNTYDYQYIDYIPTILLIASFNIMYNTYYTNSISKDVVDAISQLKNPIQSIGSINGMKVRYFLSNEVNNTKTFDNTKESGSYNIKIGATYSETGSNNQISNDTLAVDTLPFTKIQYANQAGTQSDSSNIQNIQQGVLIIEQGINQTPSWGIGLLWFFISIGLLSFSVWTYYRRDFR